MDYWSTDDLSGLEEYLSAFDLGATSKSTAPSSPDLQKILVIDAQKILAKLGAKLKQDGLFGPTTKKAWSDAARAKGLNPAFDRFDGKTAWVAIETTLGLQGVKTSKSAAAPTPPKPTSKPGARPVAPGAKPSQPSKVGLVKTSVREAQQILAKYGAKLKQDGLFGPATQKAWGDAARAKKLDTAFDRAGPNEAWVHPTTLNTLKAGSTAAKPAAKATDTKPTQPSKVGLVKVKVFDAQSALNKRGAKLKTDGLFGPATKKAWGTAAAKTKTDPTFDRAGPNEAWVHPNTLKILGAKVEVGPVTHTTTANKALVHVSVKEAQQILAKYGARLKQDGLYGPATKAAWGHAASAKKLDTTFDRGGPKDALVRAETLDILRKGSATTKPVEKPTTKPVTKPSARGVKPTEPSRSGLLKATVGVVQDILIKLKVKLKRDGLFGPATAKAWSNAAHARKLDPVFDRADAGHVWVDPKTYESLSKAAGIGVSTPTGQPDSAKSKDTQPVAKPEAKPDAYKLAADQVVKKATALTSVLNIQKATNFANLADKKYKAVKETGTWDAPTKSAFYVLFGLTTPDQMKVWDLAFPKLLANASKTVRLLPDQAQQVLAIVKAGKAQTVKPKTTAPTSPSTNTTQSATQSGSSTSVGAPSAQSSAPPPPPPAPLPQAEPEPVDIKPDIPSAEPEPMLPAQQPPVNINVNASGGSSGGGSYVDPVPTASDLGPTAPTAPAPDGGAATPAASSGSSTGLVIALGAAAAGALFLFSSKKTPAKGKTRAGF